MKIRKWGNSLAALGLVVIFIAGLWGPHLSPWEYYFMAAVDGLMLLVNESAFKDNQFWREADRLNRETIGLLHRELSEVRGYLHAAWDRERLL